MDVLHLFIEHGGAELPRLLSGDVATGMVLSAWNTQNNDAKDHHILSTFHYKTKLFGTK